MYRSKRVWFIFTIILLLVVACSNKDDDKSGETLTHQPPSLDELDPNDPQTEAILYGEELFNETNTVMPENVGNKLSCQSCHANGGVGGASSLVGVVADYPQYRPREGVTFTLEDRINGCMIRSMNGEMIDHDSEEMRAMIAYFAYISKGVEIGAERPWITVNSMDEVPEPNITRGEELYEKKNCLSCHAIDGSGTGPNTGPALWGDDSFNDGAGMGRLTKAAGYIQNNMPIGEENTLTDQEAADLAAYLLSHDRPIFEGHDEDFPHGGKPTDIITQDRREQIRAGEFDWTEIKNVIPNTD